MFLYKLEENEIGELVEYRKTKELSHIVWVKKVETALQDTPYDHLLG